MEPFYFNLKGEEGIIEKVGSGEGIIEKVGRGGGMEVSLRSRRGLHVGVFQAPPNTSNVATRSKLKTKLILHSLSLSLSRILLQFGFTDDIGS